MLDKHGTSIDSFRAMFGFDPEGEVEEKPARPAPKRPARPIPPVPEPPPPPESTPPSSEDWGFTAPVEQAVPIEQALRGEAPAPQPAPAPAEPAPAMPEWFNPSWVLPEAEEPSEEELGGLRMPELMDFPEAEPTEPAAPPAPEPTPEPEEEFTSDDAIDYFDSIEERNDDLGLAAQAVRGAEEAILADLPPKEKADALGVAIGILESLLKKPDALGDDAEKITQAVHTLTDHYSQEVNKLPKSLNERVNEKIRRQVEGPKPRPLQRRTSKWHGENVIYTRNRAIEIIRNEPEIPVDEAEARAEDEWNRIIEIVNEIAPTFADPDKKTVQVLFGKKVLGDGDFDQAEREIRELIERGLNKADDVFYDDVDPEKIDTEEALLVLTSPDTFGEEIEDLPEDYVQQLTPKIEEFGKIAQTLLKMGSDWEARLEETGGEMQLPADALMEIQNLYNKAMALSIDISSVPTEVKQQAFNDGEIFKIVYGITSKLNDYTETFGLESIDRVMSSGELAEADLTFKDPTKKKPIKGEPGKARKRYEETEQRAREKYLNLLRQSGRLEDYYKKRRDYHKGPVERETPEGETYQETQEEFEARRNPQKERSRIRNADRNQINREHLRWRTVGFKKGGPGDHKDYLRKTIMIHMQADQKLWERMAKSWLSPEEINQLAQERLDDRINTLTGDLKFLNKFPSANFYVKEVLERHIEKIPEMWEKAKARAPKVEQKEKFEPGIWSEEELAARKGKISSLLNMVDAFCKYAKTG